MSEAAVARSLRVQCRAERRLSEIAGFQAAGKKRERYALEIERARPAVKTVGASGSILQFWGPP